MKRILFLAGESGTGKSTVGRSLEDFGVLLHADLITKRAGPHYFSHENDDFCRWSLWSPEFDNEAQHGRLIKSLRQSMREHKEISTTINGALIIEGAIVGHSIFRRLLCVVLEQEFAIELGDWDIACFWLDPTDQRVYRNIQSRCRPQDKQVTIDDVGARRRAYAAMMSGQSSIRFETPAACTSAALAFLTDGAQPVHELA